MAQREKRLKYFLKVFQRLLSRFSKNDSEEEFCVQEVWEECLWESGRPDREEGG